MYLAASYNPNISTAEQIDLTRRGMNEKTKEIQAMKMGEFDTFMNDLAEVSGVPREILDKTPARALFALKSAIDERDRAREALTAYQPNDPIEEGIRRSQRGKE